MMTSQRSRRPGRRVVILTGTLESLVLLVALFLGVQLHRDFANLRAAGVKQCHFCGRPATRLASYPSRLGVRTQEFWCCDSCLQPDDGPILFEGPPTPHDDTMLFIIAGFQLVPLLLLRRYHSQVGRENATPADAISPLVLSVMLSLYSMLGAIGVYTGRWP